MRGTDATSALSSYVFEEPVPIADLPFTKPCTWWMQMQIAISYQWTLFALFALFPLSNPVINPNLFSAKYPVL